MPVDLNNLNVSVVIPIVLMELFLIPVVLNPEIRTESPASKLCGLVVYPTNPLTFLPSINSTLGNSVLATLT